jgi:hypothetical protein
MQEAGKPKKLQREEWMLVPPSSSDLLGGTSCHATKEERARVAHSLPPAIDPTKLRPRQFRATAAPAIPTTNNLWTETPAERQQRLADEVSGKRRRAANAEGPVDEEEDADVKLKRRREEQIRREVDEHTVRRRCRFTILAYLRPTSCSLPLSRSIDCFRRRAIQRKVRGTTLLTQHTAKMKSSRNGHDGDDDDDAKPAAIWEHERDMSVGGRLLDDRERDRLLKDARTLGDRFATGKGGGYLERR